MPELTELKPGDEVAIRYGMSDNYRIYQITSINKRGIIEISTGSKYRVDGSAIAKGSNKWNNPDPIQPVTDEIREAIKKNRLVGKLSTLDHNSWKKMDIETLEAVAAIIWKNGE